MAALRLAGPVEADLSSLADVSIVGSAQVVAEKSQGKGVALEFFDGNPHLAPPSDDSELAKQRDRCIGLQLFQSDLRRCLGIAGEVGDAFAGGDDAEARIAHGQALEKSREAGIFEAAFDLRPARRILQRLDAVKDQEGALTPDEGGEAGATVVDGASVGVGISEKAEGVIDERLGGGNAVFQALAVEGPVEHARDAAPVVGGHAVEPVGDQGGFADPSEGDEGKDVDGWIDPGGIEAGEVGFAADEMRAGNRKAAEVEVGVAPALPGGGKPLPYFGFVVRVGRFVARVGRRIQQIADPALGFFDLLAQGKLLGGVGGDRFLLLKESESFFPCLQRPRLCRHSLILGIHGEILAEAAAHLTSAPRPDTMRSETTL